MKKIIDYIDTHTVLSSILLYFVGYLLIGSILIALPPDKYQVYVRLAISIILFFSMIRISKKEFNNVLEQINDTLGKSALNISLVTILIFFINIILSYISIVVLKQSTYNNNVIMFLFSKHPYIIGIITILLLPFVEELLFKSQIFKNTKFLAEHKIIKTIIVAMIFASFHSISEIVSMNYRAIFTFINYMSFYIITNTLYIRSKYNIMKPIAVHMLVNALSLIVGM